MATDPPSFSFIGRDLPRSDGREKVTGTAAYSAEWQIAGLAYGAVVDSAISRGTITEIDASAALAAPGVITVVTHENAPRLAPYPEKGGGFQLTGDGGLGEARQPLQDGAIWYGAQSIAVVVADTSERARYAATLVRVAYAEQPPELDLRTSTHSTFPDMFAGVEPMQKGGAELDAALAQAPVRLIRRYDTSVNHHNAIELFATTAVWDKRDGDDALTLYDTTRAVDMLRDVVAHAFELPTENVRVVSKFIGGAFGSKAWSYHNPLLVALAARVAKRPVKVEWRRQQGFSIGGHRPATLHTLDIGSTPDGRLTALRHGSRTHSSVVSGYTEFGARMTRMMYDVPHIGYSNELVHLNLPSPSVMRGPGFLMGSFALESALDELAEELKTDPVALRLKNYAEVDPDSGLPFSSKHLRECYERGAESFGWQARNATPRTRRVGNDWIGYGMSSCMHPAARAAASARATIHADGSAVVCSATHELGNGAYTIFRQIAADGFALPLERVTFELGDTALPSAPPTHGSLTTATVGPAVFEAARSAVGALKDIAVRDRGSALFGLAAEDIDAREGQLYRRDRPAVAEEFGAILRRAGRGEVAASADAAPGNEDKEFSFHSFGAVFAEVRVDEETGVVRVARLGGVYDAGRTINPRTARSQLMGGMIFGLGATLMEETVFDPHNGLPVVRNLADYHIAACADTPDISIEILDFPDFNRGELGARGVGEMGGNGVPAAIANAIYNACGVRMRSLPITPDKVLVR